jgi:hypothetical protein
MKDLLLITVCGVLTALGATPPVQDGHSHDSAKPSAAKKPSVGCAKASFAPEVVTFYGDSKAVLEKLDGFQGHLEERRVYMFLAETAGSAEVALFERADGTNVRLSKWQGKSVGELRDRISTATLANRGIACIGEQVKSLVLRTLPTENMGVIPAPVTLRAAFGHNVNAYGSDYLRVTIYLLC